MGGRSFMLPFLAPPATQASSVCFSSSVSLRSFSNVPAGASACHGGMCPSLTSSLMALAYGRASSYVKSDIGAISPGRWQVVQFLQSMGATSLVNGEAAALDAVAAEFVCSSPGADNDAASVHAKIPESPATTPTQTVDWMRMAEIVA